MYIDAIGFDNDQKNKTIVFALAGWQAKLHITQEMDRTIGPDTDLVLWQDENHCLRDRVFIQLVKDPVYPVDCPL